MAKFEPKDNPFKSIGINITHKCNMNCSNCFLPERNKPDLDRTKLLDCLKELPKPVYLRILGGEPTVREDLPEIISDIKNNTKHIVSLLTNGLKMADFNYTMKLKEAGLRICYVSFNGVTDDEIYEKMDGARCAEQKIKAVDNIIKSGMYLNLGCIVARGINDDSPKKLLEFVKEKGLKNVYLKFKTVGQIGRYLEDVSYGIEEFKDLLAEQLGVTVEHINHWESKMDDERILRFPIDPINPKSDLLGRGGIWASIAHWNREGHEKLFKGEKQGGKITRDFKIVNYYESLDNDD